MKNVIESFTKACDVVIYSNKNDDEIDLKDKNGKRRKNSDVIYL